MHKVEPAGRGIYRLVNERTGDLARNTNGEPFFTARKERAEEAARYLNQVTICGKRVGPYWLKSTFGAL